MVQISLAADGGGGTAAPAAAAAESSAVMNFSRTIFCMFLGLVFGFVLILVVGHFISIRKKHRKEAAKIEKKKKKKKEHDAAAERIGLLAGTSSKSNGGGLENFMSYMAIFKKRNATDSSPGGGRSPRSPNRQPASLNPSDLEEGRGDKRSTINPTIGRRSRSVSDITGNQKGCWDPDKVQWGVCKRKKNSKIASVPPSKSFGHSHLSAQNQNQTPTQNAVMAFSRKSDSPTPSPRHLSSDSPTPSPRHLSSDSPPRRLVGESPPRSPRRLGAKSTPNSPKRKSHVSANRGVNIASSILTPIAKSNPTRIRSSH